MGTGLTEALARFVAGARPETLPAGAVRQAKRAILDTVGVTLAAVDDATARGIVRFVDEIGGRPVASIIGHRQRTSAPNAALANGTLGHALDWDDTNLALNGHPSVVALPAALALCEAEGRSGRDLIAAYVCGFEVAARVGRALGVGHYERGWHATGTAGALGAAAAAARARDLDERRTRRAFGSAATHAGGLRQNFGTSTKPFHAGNAARAGVVAALLAREGFTADESILEGRFGLLNVVGEADRSAERGLKGLGERFHILDTGIGVKVYPACASAHHALDAIFNLLAREPVAAADVERVVCAVPFRVPMVLVYERPQTALEGKFSLQYCVAAALLDRRVGLAQFTDAAVRRPEAQALFPRIEMVVPEEGRDPMRPNFAEVTIETRDGRRLTERVEHVRGSPKRPLSEAELEAKFRDAAAAALDPATADRLLDQLRRLEMLPDLRAALDLACHREMVRR